MCVCCVYYQTKIQTYINIHTHTHRNTHTQSNPSHIQVTTKSLWRADSFQLLLNSRAKNHFLIYIFGCRAINHFVSSRFAICVRVRLCVGDSITHTQTHKQIRIHATYAMSWQMCVSMDCTTHIGIERIILCMDFPDLDVVSITYPFGYAIRQQCATSTASSRALLRQSVHSFCWVIGNNMLLYITIARTIVTNYMACPEHRFSTANYVQLRECIYKRNFT